MLDNEPGEQTINIRSITLPSVERSGFGVDLESLISPAVWEKFIQIAAQENPRSPDAQITLTANVKAAFPDRASAVPVNENSLMRVRNWVSDAYVVGELEDCADWLYDLMPLILGKQEPLELKKLMETVILEKANSPYYPVMPRAKIIFCIQHLYPRLYAQIKTAPSIDEIQRAIGEVESKGVISGRDYAKMISLTRLYAGEGEWSKFNVDARYVANIKNLIEFYASKGNYHGIAELAKDLAIITADTVSVDEQGIHLYRAPKQKTKSTPLPVLKTPSHA